MKFTLSDMFSAFISGGNIGVMAWHLSERRYGYAAIDLACAVFLLTQVAIYVRERRRW